MREYVPKDIEEKWQKVWEELELFKATDEGKKVYVLEMFPYPSGKIHMGHVRNYTIGDVVARFLRFKGYRVLHPMGWDAFGLPAENAAIKQGIHPADWTYKNIAYMKNQLKRLGFSYDWDREIATCDPEYYRWNQWIFLKFYERGLAYRKLAEVNWCPNDETVLANEQVIDGRCWRCGTPVIRKEVPSWYLKITHYADRLLEDLKLLEGKWPERVISQQRNWIGRSEGAIIKFYVDDTVIEVFTTRPDTVFGATFLVLAPEHPLTLSLAEKGGKIKEALPFVERIRSIPPKERGKEEQKEGVFLGVYAVNPANGEKVPVWSANYVLYEYGTGAIMAVPAHDQRDYEFAIKYNLPIKQVISPYERELPPDRAYEGEGVLINSGPFDGLSSAEAKKVITSWLKDRGHGDFKITYRLKDWNISRQRYWGTPIPIIYCQRCGTVPVPEEDLPVLLPKDVKITGHGNPLESVEEFVNTTCPKCKGPAKRETDTMDTFFDSSWYFLRYCDPKNESLPFDPQKANFWMPVDIYIGGIEHAVLHLLYARFFQKFLKDLNLVKDEEPFLNLITQGMVLRRWVSIESYLSYLGLTEEDSSDKLLENISKEVKNVQGI
ncbi:MAG: leucine--tRNA ligase [Hydrogenobacter thermophilus]|uniref:leucine--tRNA ligase n=1 Tax=Hydrogenobacter thermophilus TaxID=940 RepID=UPI001C75B02D|nr:leucine--tRNA ligase [Hydrogenobacter thermophilus]QWK20329.1 MAG: leucine--tRNA ligase [Hydrogenobacter thermophilus]